MLGPKEQRDLMKTITHPANEELITPEIVDEMNDPEVMRLGLHWGVGLELAHKALKAAEVEYNHLDPKVGVLSQTIRFEIARRGNEQESQTSQ